MEADAIRGELRAGRYPDAEKHARELLRATERLHGVESLEVANVLDLLAEALRRGGKKTDPEARSVCERALAIKARLLPPEDLSFVVSLENLGALHLMNRNFAQAREPLQRTLDIRTRVLGPVHADVARALLFLGHLHYTSAQDESALVCVERAIAIQDSVLLPDDDPARAQALELLTGIHYQRGEYREAVAVGEKVLAIRIRTLGLDHPSTSSTFHNLGSIVSEMGDLEDAADYLEQARAVMKRAGQPNHPIVARSLASLASVREKEGNLEGALALYREAVKLQRQNEGPENQDAAWNLMHAGRLQLSLNRPAPARKDLMEALRIQEKVLEPGHSDLAWTLSVLAVADAKAGNVALAIRRSTQALTIQERTIGTLHPDYAATLAHLAHFHALSGDTSQALEAALRSARIRTEHLRITAGGLAERQALAYASRAATGLDVALSVVAHPGARGTPASVRQTWDAVVQARTLVLDEMAARHHAALAETVSVEVGVAATTLKGARQRLANLLVRGPGDDTLERYQNLVRRARLDMERAERALGARSPGRSDGRTAGRGLQDVLSSMPEGWGLIAYSSYVAEGARQYVAFVRGTAGEPMAVAIGSAARVDALVRQWANDILSDRSESGAAAARAEAAGRRSGRALRAAIWDPVRDLLKDAIGVLVVPDGALHGVNLGALPRDGGGYLAEDDFLIHYVTSEQDLLAKRSREAHGTGLLAFGGVEFGPIRPPRKAKPAGDGISSSPSEDCDGFYGTDFHPLPQSRLEVEEIAGAWDDAARATVVVGADATESAFKRLAPGKRVIHLATHGFFLNPGDCFSGVSGARGIGGLESGVRPRRKPAFHKQSPLHLSGLALAAANRRSESTPEEEDGILAAEEVASLDLRGVEWAVLSACDTGVGGTVAGEGILGLRRAFQTAGVGTLVISLWPVQDQAAREWMRALYRVKFHEGVGTARAVRAAMLEVLRSRRVQGRSTNPSFWAAFLAAGDWN
ncbi:MAG TPA: CHAT domain-containing tetratricopeptide repeat protein [Acidobacteriota bacterium]|nr:CHAT domain-containing tetratricopeptide repeat protein [Acidobacteriota bacterium]